jgi:hypothetical protein
MKYRRRDAGGAICERAAERFDGTCHIAMLAFCLASAACSGCTMPEEPNRAPDAKRPSQASKQSRPNII